MEEPKKIIEEATDNIKEYLNTCYELRMLQATEKISNATSEVVSSVFIVFIGMLSILFLSLAVAYYFSFVAIGDRYSGFFIVGGAYVVIGMVLLFFRRKILEHPIRNKIIQAIFKEEPMASILNDKKKPVTNS